MTWILILMTWYGTIAPMTQDIPVRDEANCRRIEANLERDWKEAPKEFVYIIVCRSDKRFE